MDYKIWVYSDPHFSHANILKFETYKGDRLRPHWDDINKMDADLIAMYNDLVDDKDRVYILGDVAFSQKTMAAAVSQLKGRKVLIPGNHEPRKMRGYIGLFDDVRGYVQRDGIVMSHVPLHPDCLERWGLNIHGHLHNNEVMYRDGGPDIRYYCACVERTGFKPKLLNEILEERGLKTI